MLLDRENILGKTCANILRKLFSREVAIQFTAARKMPNKKLISATSFCECISGRGSFF